jgi:phenylacetyl-CoA:acceptor oxidoreductase subunit 2
MSRESIVAALLFAAGGAALFVAPAFAWLAAPIALAFIYCQSRILQASRGIPAWRAPALIPLNFATALVEGAGLLCVVVAVQGTPQGGVLYAFPALLVLRGYAWLVYLRRLPAGAPALAPLEDAGRVLHGIGTLAPLALLVVGATGWVPDPVATALIAAAGLMAACAGGYVKYCLVTRAGYNQGFALAHLPVRGARS